MLLALSMSTAFSGKYFVSQDGDDTHDGSAARPFRTISAAARVAQPGDVITVREGVYRERINPPRGGTSDNQRIVYQAADGETVVIKGSERIKGWEKVQHDTWKVTLANDFFGDFNPYNDPIAGDWFDSRGRAHHTGAVYLNGHWLTEAASVDDVLQPIRETPIWAFLPASGYLLNVGWLCAGQAAEAAVWIPAVRFAAQRGIQSAAYSEGGECIGYIMHGDWVRYDRVDFGQGAEQMTFRASSDTQGGTIEIRLGALDGEVLGTVAIPHTGGWQSWQTFTADIRPVHGKNTIYLVFKSPDEEMVQNKMYDPQSPCANPELWFAEVNDQQTTIWAQFRDINPNTADVEINVRQTVFYPDRPGINYITVRGFTMMHAATPWAPPTAEQIGLIGTHWSRGWIIEDNDISYSVCTGITLGKHGDRYDNTSANSAEGYVKTIERAHAFSIPWTKEDIGHHIVRNNRISHCEQAGLVGSLGAIFSTITNNTIHDIHVRRLFCGAEMAGIKLHAPIDTLISRNHIYRANRGIWLDWMTQGTRVTRNLLHDNGGPSQIWDFEDLFIEVNHGPYVVDNNILLSKISLWDNSQGGAYLHNLFAGSVRCSAEFNRDTPYHKAHSTEIAGLTHIQNGDNRFYNNIFAGGNGLGCYDNAILPVSMAGNVFLKGASPSRHEADPLVLPAFDPAIKLSQNDGRVTLEMTFEPSITDADAELVTTDRLGKARIPDLPFMNYDGAYLKIDTDYFGQKRSEQNPSAGPFEKVKGGVYIFEVKK